MTSATALTHTAPPPIPLARVGKPEEAQLRQAAWHRALKYQKELTLIRPILHGLLHGSPTCKQLLVSTMPSHREEQLLSQPSRTLPDLLPTSAIGLGG